MQLPACGPLDAVDHGQVPALLGLQVVFWVGVPCGDDIPSGVFADFLRHPVHDGLRLRSAQGAVDEVVLHVNDQ